MLWKRSAAPAGGPILRLRPGTGFGDHLMLSAAIEGIRAEHPRQRIHVAARHPEVFQHNPHVEELVGTKELNAVDPGRIESYVSAVHRPAEERHLQVAGHLVDDIYDRIGLPLRERPRQPRIYLTEKETRFRRRRLEALPRPRVAIVPHGKTSVWLPNKIYPADQWEALARLLCAVFPSVLQLGTRKDGPLLPAALDYRDVGFRNTAAVLSHCDLLVTHVGGLMHLGAAMRTPSVVLYGGAEHPAISGYPWNRNLYVPIECGPCWLKTVCPHHSCMRVLTPMRVMAEVAAAFADLAEGRFSTRPDGLYVVA